MSINHVALVGNLTRSPELRSTASGTPVLSFGIAVNDSRKDASGQWVDVPNFFECSTFGNRATALSDILTKGMKVAITGKLHYSSWEKDGKKHSKVDIIAREIELMQNRKPQQGYQPPQQAQPEPQWNARQAYAEAPQPEFYDEVLPF
ncbi:MAG: Single-strand binding protein family protein [Bacteriophage sp.]|nr:MAG: Single-strand binding protein family protein [Bacteriophage sp.]